MTQLLAIIMTPTSLLAEVASPAAGHSYRPFLDPLDLHDRWWLTLLPLALGIALAYKAVRVRTFDDYFKQVLTMTGMIILGMVASAAALYVFVQWIVPML
ncbi:MAG TPA: hypothetical protein VG797_05420 [Phycisphaerales bacterium]|nr:hypothetical protein [Phycisphaerales bacterium]